jgi:hypothetical protein
MAIVLLLVAVAVPARAQLLERVIVKADRALIYRREVHIVIAQARLGILLDVTGREGNFYVIAVPPELGGQLGQTGLIAVSQVAPAPNREPDELPTRPTEPEALAGGGSRAVRTPVKMLAFGQVGFVSWLATNTFNAVFGSSGAPMVGGGVRVQRGTLFVDGGFDWFENTSHGALPYNGGFVSAIPESVRIIPIAGTIGYRHPGRTGTPYIGAGAGVTLYREAPQFGSASENLSQVFGAYHILGGVEMAGWGPVGLAVEAQFTTVPGALASSGMSTVYDEHNLGGFQIRAKILIGK